jgi:hypothetical protein
MLRLAIKKILSSEIRVPSTKIKHDDPKVAMLMALPGYGEKKAKKALDDNVWLYDELGKIIEAYT